MCPPRVCFLHAVLYYIVSTSTGGAPSITVDVSSPREAILTGLANGQSYVVTVAAVSTVGSSSLQSSDAFVPGAVFQFCQNGIFHWKWLTLKNSSYTSFDLFRRTFCALKQQRMGCTTAFSGILVCLLMVENCFCVALCFCLENSLFVTDCSYWDLFCSECPHEFFGAKYRSVDGGRNP